MQEDRKAIMKKNIYISCSFYCFELLSIITLELKTYYLALEKWIVSVFMNHLLFESTLCKAFDNNKKNNNKRKVVQDEPLMVPPRSSATLSTYFLESAMI